MLETPTLRHLHQKNFLLKHRKRAAVRGLVFESFNLKIFEGPDDFLFPIDFDQLRIVRTGVAIVDQKVAAGKNLKRSHPRQLNSRQLVLIQTPHDLSCRCHFQNAVSVAGADEGAAASQSNGGKALIAERFDSVPVRRFAVEQRNTRSRLSPHERARCQTGFRNSSKTTCNKPDQPSLRSSSKRN